MHSDPLAILKLRASCNDFSKLVLIFSKVIARKSFMSSDPDKTKKKLPIRQKVTFYK